MTFTRYNWPHQHWCDQMLYQACRNSLHIEQKNPFVQNSTRVLRGKAFGTPTPKCLVIFCPKPGQKIVNFIALSHDRPDYILPGLEQFIINPKWTSFRLQQTCEYALKWSNDIMKRANQEYQSFYLLSLGMKACFPSRCKFIPKNL